MCCPIFDYICISYTADDNDINRYMDRKLNQFMLSSLIDSPTFASQYVLKLLAPKKGTHTDTKDLNYNCV